MRRRILLLPGATRGDYPEYQEIYESIAQGARKKFGIDGFDYFKAVYPGHCGRSSGLLSYNSALNAVMSYCREFKPNWIIGSSLGGYVAIGALASEEDWVNEVEGAVVWGTSTKSSVADAFANDDAKQKQVNKYSEKLYTFITPDFFDTFPDTEALIAKVKCNLRLSCGSADHVGVKKQDLELLADIHRRAQPDYCSEVREIVGLKHSVKSSDIAPALLSEYLDCLFSPFDNNSSNA